MRGFPGYGVLSPWSGGGPLNTMRLALIAILLFTGLAWLPAVARADDAVVLPHPALLRGQQFLRQAEAEGAAAIMPVETLLVQEMINAAWSAYHHQVEENADDADDDEAILARRLAEEAELDALLLRVSLRTRHDEARLDGVRASLNLPPLQRLEIPPPLAPDRQERP
jgi:hypothetical protein